MDYEKKYNEALKWMRELYPRFPGAFKEEIEHYFPELAESEDERIRKELISFLRSPFIKENLTDEKVAPWLEWLEKQKEKMTAEEYEKSELFQLKLKTKYANGYQDGLAQKEQKPELVQQPPITYTYNSNASRDERLKAALLALLNSDLLKVKEGGYFTKQDLIEWVERIPTDKPVAWSEEDKKILDDVSHILIGLNYKQIAKDYKQAVEKLIYARPSWKPSEEQMYALAKAVTLCGSGLDSLYQDLKKLM